MTAAQQDGRQSMVAMPLAVKDAAATKNILHRLRHFHLGNPAMQEQLEALGDNFLPVLLAEYRDTSNLRYDYPLFLYPADAASDEILKPLSRFLSEQVEQEFPGESNARLLKDNLVRLEHAVRISVEDTDAPLDALTQFRTQADSMLQQLALDTESNKKLQHDLSQLFDAMPVGQLLAYGTHPAVHLLIHSVRHEVVPRERVFREQMELAIRQLQNLLEVEHEKSAAGSSPEILKESVGLSASMFDANALSDVMDHSQGSISMSSERKARVEQALATLQSFAADSVLVRLVHQQEQDVDVFATVANFETVVADEPCIKAKELFDTEAAHLADVFVAMRIAQLEMDGLYDTAIHDPWFANFNWEAFSQDELLLVPAVIALESAQRAAGEAMSAFSQLLNSGRPVQLLVRVLGHSNPARIADENPFAHYRTELGYLGIAHRQAVVCQSSAARPEHLLAQFQTALQATRTGLHLINVGLRPTGQDLGLNGWLVAGAALEGRVHPFFQVNPAAGDSFADRIDFSGNPQAEKDWPEHVFMYQDENGDEIETTLNFTFADYALLIPRLYEHFTPIPSACETEYLCSVSEYLQLDEKDAGQYIPFIWAVNDKGELRQLAVSRILIHACKDRLNFWHSLQEMAGVRSKYLEQGIAAVKAELGAEMQTEKLQVAAAHSVEIQAVREEAASEVMGRLTDVLMGMDFSSAAAGVQRTPLPAVDDVVAEAVVADIPEEPAVPEAVAEESFDEPWIDSPLCTSCNDCLVLNPQMFVYDDSNQAYITDPKLGTFVQLVEAAELCPANCIHPGKPLNGSEANLEELIERAAVYN